MVGLEHSGSHDQTGQFLQSRAATTANYMTVVETGVQGGSSASTGSEAEGEEVYREGLLDVFPPSEPRELARRECVACGRVSTGEGSSHQVRQGERPLPSWECADARSQHRSLGMWWYFVC